MYRKQAVHQHKAGEAMFTVAYLQKTQSVLSAGMTRLLNRSFAPDTAEVPGAYKQQSAGWDVECRLPSPSDQSHKCSDGFRK